MKVDLSTLPADCRIADVIAICDLLGFDVSISTMPVARAVRDGNGTIIHPGDILGDRILDQHVNAEFVEGEGDGSFITVLYPNGTKHSWTRCETYLIRRKGQPVGKPSVEIPLLSSYLRIGDVVDTPHGRSTVRTVGTKGVSGWRLVLCFQTVNVGDRLVDEGGKQWEVLETATENCSLLDGADAMRLVTWPDLDRDYKMLARSGKREDAE
jgi:hypothetical protein